MTTGEPLLLSSSGSADPPSKQEVPAQSSVGSLGCLCRTDSFSSSLYEDCDTASVNLADEGEAVPRHCREESDVSRVAECFQSADSHLFHRLSVECSQKERQQKVSWGGVMEMQCSPSSLEIGVVSSSQEKPNRSQRVRHKITQFEDPFSSEHEPRLIYINDPNRTNDRYEFTGNEIRTSKYTLITFLPKNLFIQFHRLAYVYFLVIAALNQLPPLAVFGRTASLFPLLFVLFVTAIKDGYEDWRRHRSDRNENNREALVLQYGDFQSKKWKKICAGEVVKIHSNETMPCDMVLLGTSDPNGIAYIQTMNLDGESNLKTRYARQETTSMVCDGSYSGLIKCEQPNRNIYEFTATMELNNQRIPLGQSNIVLRGCQLKNTEWIVGVVVYAGQETKAMLNSTISPSKSSNLESYMNRETLWLSAFLLITCSVVATGMGVWLFKNSKNLDALPYYRRKYFTFGRENRKDFKFYGIALEIFFSFLSSVIIFQIMIPISLYITMEVVRVGQSYFMIGDTRMYDSSSGSRFQCRSLNINEDLGQIRYIFSDKTGTLTQNKMEFQQAIIYGKNYGSSLQVSSDSSNEISTTESLRQNGRNPKSAINVDSALMALLNQPLVEEERLAAHDFFLTLAACNTVIPVSTDSSLDLRNKVNEIGAIDYQGESPDEQALVTAASSYGYTLVERTTGHIVIDVQGERIRLDVLGLHEFDSVRKRMSVVVKFPDNNVKVLVKGADTSMLSILKVGIGGLYDSLHAKIREATENHLSGCSSEGLRTLVIGSKNLTDAEFGEWQEKYKEASTSMHERSAKLRQAAGLVECNLTLLGATGIEDKLQDGVPEAIESLRQAGIKVWVLTGDKQETAISIGLSCRLLTQSMHSIIINGSSEFECRRLLADAKAKFGIKSSDFGRDSQGMEDLYNGDVSKSRSSNGYISESAIQNFQLTGVIAGDKLECSEKVTNFDDTELALIIDGSSLVYILEKDLESELFDLATSCKVVICCRVAPLQKAGIVDLIKSRTSDMTLAIGDGANDVSMIQMADVGVGICGQEGRQAVMASDFAMGQFRFLKRLLLVHGHWNYQRIAYMILYNFYRNAVFVLMLFWYILYTAYSATLALTDWSSVFYSLIYTSVPTVVVGILDKDLSHNTLLYYPRLYEAGLRNEGYNLTLFWITMLDTLWQSLVLFYVPFFTYNISTMDIWSMGSLWTIAVVIIVNIHLAMDVRRWVLITHLAVWGSIAATFLCMVLIDSIPIFPNYGTIYNMAASRTYWLSVCLIIVLGLLPRFLCKVIYQTFWPSDIQIAREAELLKKLPQQLGSRLESDII
ncbi:phospholipid-transporting ATPase 1-like isoform X1 [Phragmites australis]|uniref:phospholipid-transporting ATPase 1-like isoform X1 n=2 Tax=Phragmites australis TaxID=29695 RepID=UPI002D778052|nr:phospholipid-transporting ATPase 1-like isoform X1 [Phragmites australis]XP_062215677.1 phospholipid-transporting ATPase 1-like isoform X1 [Phragmites australis]XP_062215678.1 phospholipid-transporting ATPase 1-like isoform X1 [Phragmites australis]